VSPSRLMPPDRECARERERGRESESVWGRERECVRERGRDRERERDRCLTQVDSHTILDLTCWACGANPSTLEPEIARDHQTVERIETYDGAGFLYGVL